MQSLKKNKNVIVRKIMLCKRCKLLALFFPVGHGGVLSVEANQGHQGLNCQDVNGKLCEKLHLLNEQLAVVKGD